MKTNKISSGGCAHGWCFQDLEICGSNLLREYNVDLLELLYDFSKQASSLVQSTAVCSATFRRDLLLQLFNPYHIPGNLRRHRSPSHRPARDCVFTLFCVLRDEHLSIDRPVCPFFAWPTAAAGFVCYAAVILLATAS